jgi:diaminopimelate epimerase
MLIEFYKYHGAGNDFIILDNRLNKYNALSNEQIYQLCDRHIGIGADGLMVLQSSDKYNFEMVYYNSDGNIGTMCGNGGRCIVAFAKEITLVDSKVVFQASDGIHYAIIKNDNVCLDMKNVNLSDIEKYKDGYIIDTGSPHFVKFIKRVTSLDVFTEGRQIRKDPHFGIKGINVDFVEIINEAEIIARTYERGVENETLSCGTGAVASSIIFNLINNGNNSIAVKTLGGVLNVSFDYDNHKYSNIKLDGPAKYVYKGIIEL